MGKSPNLNEYHISTSLSLSICPIRKAGAKLIRVAVVGIGGRMGSLIAKLISQTTDIQVVAASEQPGNPLVGTVLDMPGSAKVEQGDRLDLSKAQVLVDFTTPANTLNMLRRAKEAGCAAVVGTTGFTPSETMEITEIAKNIPVLFSPNMSIGVNVFFRSVAALAKQLDSSYDIEVVELHHRHKKDAPSGTAKRLIELIGRDVPCHSLRIGGVVGEHQVHFAGNGERIILTHQAENRETFAQGALLAIRFICRQSPGLYTMFDVLDNND